jgi:DNA uptake protein ComE-like DNA-binding protein
MKATSVIALFGVLGLAGCTTANSNPDAIRHDTAVATASAARNTKAVAQGIFDGLKPQKGPMNINTASSSDLQRLPGVDADTADRIIANRPYRTTEDLLRRHMVSRAQYAKFSGQVVAN